MRESFPTSLQNASVGQECYLCKRSRGAFFGASAIVLALALLPQGTAPGPDKLHHFLAFMGLAIFGSLGWPQRPRHIAAILFALAAGIELVQGTELIGRDAEVLDWIAGAAGVLSAGLVASLVRRLAA
jgi:hypothetical protein